MFHHPHIADELARQHQRDLRRDGAQPTLDGGRSTRHQAVRFTVVAIASMLLALVAGSALARAVNLPLDSTSAVCPTPAAPVVHVVSPSAVTLASWANPGGNRTQVQLLVDGAPAYSAAVDRATRRVGWQVTIGTLEPGRSYTILARAVAAGCRRQSTTLFTMPAASSTATVGPAAIPVTTDADVPPVIVS